jgi:hypothetical protein
LAFFNYIQKREGQPGVSFMDAKSSGDKTPAPVDGKTKTVIPAGEIPIGTGADYGLQYWMYISDWDYRFGQDKEILKRVASNNPTIVGPRIFLAPTENTLHVRISLYPSNTDAASAEPGTSSTGDSFTCSVENVPLQSWFAVSVTVFQRNLDIYINGRLVKSCVLPGIPKPALGDVVLADNGGFSGSICNEMDMEPCSNLQMPRVSMPRVLPVRLPQWVERLKSMITHSWSDCSDTPSDLLD